MAQENTVLKQKLKHKGHWNFSDLYTFCFGWLEDNGYAIAEKEYTEKISTFGKEILIEWEAIRNVTDYFQYKIKLKWHILGLKDVEAELEGKKIKTNNGDLKIDFQAIIVKDYESRWENKPMWKFLRGTYDKYIIRTTTEEHIGKISGEVTELISQVKAFLNLGK